MTPDLATAYGTYTGTITATGDGVTAHATVALNREQPTVKVTLTGLMPDGTPATGSSVVTLRDLTDSGPPAVPPGGSRRCGHGTRQAGAIHDLRPPP